MKARYRESQEDSVNEPSSVCSFETAQDQYQGQKIEALDRTGSLRQAYQQCSGAENILLEKRIVKSEERRRAFMHILSDLNKVNRKLNDQRKAMIYILADTSRIVVASRGRPSAWKIPAAPSCIFCRILINRMYASKIAAKP